jgi:hypothetical protein
LQQRLFLKQGVTKQVVTQIPGRAIRPSLKVMTAAPSQNALNETVNTISMKWIFLSWKQAFAK